MQHKRKFFFILTLCKLHIFQLKSMGKIPTLTNFIVFFMRFNSFSSRFGVVGVRFAIFHSVAMAVLATCFFFVSAMLRGQQTNIQVDNAATLVINNHRVTKDYAQSMIRRWSEQGNPLRPVNSSIGVVGKGVFFSLLNQPKAAALRFTIGLDAAENIHAIMTATDVNNAMILPPKGTVPVRGIVLPLGNAEFNTLQANNLIGREYAHALVERYRNSPYYEKYHRVVGGTIAKEAFLEVLNNNPNVGGFKMYFGLNELNHPQVVYVPVNINGEELWNSDSAMLLDRGTPCPPFCQGEEF